MIFIKDRFCKKIFTWILKSEIRMVFIYFCFYRFSCLPFVNVSLLIAVYFVFHIYKKSNGCLFNCQLNILSYCGWRLLFLICYLFILKYFIHSVIHCAVWQIQSSHLVSAGVLTIILISLVFIFNLLYIISDCYLIKIAIHFKLFNWFLYDSSDNRIFNSIIKHLYNVLFNVYIH